MPTAPKELPRDLVNTPFTLADAQRFRVPRHRLRARDVDGRVYGVRVAGGDTDELLTRCRAFAARLPSDVFFSHSTAARLLGAPIPLRLERLADLHVTVEAPNRAPHASGLRGHSRQVFAGDVIRFSGLLVSSPVRLWCEMARALDLFELVALTDHLIHHRLPWTTITDLSDRLDVRDRLARTKQLRAALTLSSDRSESPPESVLRVICVLAGLPAPSINHEIIDVVTGKDLRLDLAWPELRFALEYQGDGHRTKAQWRRDMTRRENLRLGGWRILELNADDLGRPDVLVARIRSALSA
jgi:hypothetical protein